MNYSKKPKHSLKLPRNRILRKDDIKQILNSGIKKTGAFLNIYYQKSSEEKFAVLVFKKSGSAVDRNSGKRIIREIYRLNPQWFPNLRVVFLLKDVKISSNTLSVEIKKLLFIQ